MYIKRLFVKIVKRLKDNYPTLVTLVVKYCNTSVLLNTTVQLPHFRYKVQLILFNVASTYILVNKIF